MGKTKFTRDTDIKRIHNKYEEGSTIKSIAEEYNCSPLTIRSVLTDGCKDNMNRRLRLGLSKKEIRHNSNIKTNNEYKKLDIFEVVEIINEYDKGISSREIAKNTNHSKKTIDNVLNGDTYREIRNNVQRRYRYNLSISQESQIKIDYALGNSVEKLADKYMVDIEVIQKITKDVEQMFTCDDVEEEDNWGIVDDEDKPEETYEEYLERCVWED